MNYVVKKDAEQLKEDAIKLQNIITNLVNSIDNFDLLSEVYLLIVHNKQ